MGYAVQVGPEALTADASRLARVAETVDGIADRLAGGCGVAAAAAGGAELSTALESAGRTASGALHEAAALVADLGLATDTAATDYRLLEQALTRRWAGPRDDAGWDR